MFRINKTFIKSEKRMYIIRGIILSLFVLALTFLLKGVKFAFLVLGAAALHELGHLVFAKLFRVPLLKVKGSFFGIWLGYDFSGKGYLTQIIVSCAGAAFNVIVACVLLLCVRPTVETVFFIFSNLALALFNLMPVSRFDGIGVVRCLLLTLTRDACKAERVCLYISRTFSLVFFVFTVYVQMRVGINLPMLAVSVLLLLNSVSEGVFGLC